MTRLVNLVIRQEFWSSRMTRWPLISNADDHRHPDVLVGLWILNQHRLLRFSLIHIKTPSYPDILGHYLTYTVIYIDNCVPVRFHRITSKIVMQKTASYRRHCHRRRFGHILPSSPAKRARQTWTLSYRHTVMYIDNCVPVWFHRITSKTVMQTTASYCHHCHRRRFGHILPSSGTNDYILVKRQPWSGKVLLGL